MTGISRRQLDYWAGLRLVSPRARWGERFYSFADLVALETIKRLTAHHIPARRVRRAISALQTELGEAGARLPQLRVFANAREVVVLPPVPRTRPIEPLSGQFVLQFETEALADNVHTLASRTAEEWFEIGLACDSCPETLEQAAEAYRRALELAPGWVEAHINLGATLSQLGRIEGSKLIFAAAAELAPTNPLVHFNLGCVLDQLGDLDSAIVHLRRAVELAPSLADAHLNLALAYNRRGATQLARKHLSLYLRHEPQGPWAEFARLQMRADHSPRRSGKLTPFRRRA